MKLSISFCILLLFTISCSSKSETIDLKLNYKKGDQFTVVSTTEIVSGSVISYKSYIEVRFTVDSVKDNVYIIRSEIVHMKNESVTGRKNETYDSQKQESGMSAEEREMHDEFREMMDVPLILSMNNKGKMKGGFKFADGRAAGQPVDMSNIQIIFPAESVKVGSKWSNEKTYHMTSAPNIFTYTIREITADKILIDVEVKIGWAKRLIGDSKATGEYILDRKNFGLISGKLEMDLMDGDSSHVVYKMYRK